MKFQKGLLEDVSKPASERSDDNAVPTTDVRTTGLAIDDDRLFQTHRRTGRSWRQYVKLLGVVSVFVTAAGIVIFYLTLPSVGDRVRAPQGLEEAMRSHFLDTEKRTATDIEFYYCGEFYWARVDVEKRPDIKTNPIYGIGTYTARAAGDPENGWQITAVPVTSAEPPAPCG